MAMIDLVDVSFNYPSQKLIDFKADEKQQFAINHFTLHIPNGRVTVLLGPSGCGKSTILRIIAGLLRQDGGEVLFNGRAVDRLVPGERRIGMVFQDFALYPHFDAETNITSYFFFKKKTPELQAKRKLIFERTSELLGVELKHLLRRKPPKLSGGEQQRVAVGRCITREPDIFLLDEPFSNLDARLREHYRLMLKKLLKQFAITTVYVTHDQREAALLADELVIMNRGRIEQRGKLTQIYDNPENIFTADFISFSSEMAAINFFPGETFKEEYTGTVIGARPADITIEAEGKPASDCAHVLEAKPLPGHNEFEVIADYRNTVLHIKAELANAPAAGTDVNLFFRKYFVFDKKTEKLMQTVIPGENA